MNLKALSFGAVLGFLVAVIPSCGAPPCGPANCTGCCDSTNKCVPSSASNSNTACGTKGATCANCSAIAQTCNATSFVCEGNGTGGGTGGGTTGGGTGGGTTGGGTGGGTTGGGTGGGTTGGGTGGGTTGGGTGGGTTGGGTGGGTTGGGGGTTGCTVTATGGTGCPSGQSCMYKADQSTACFAGPCDVVTQNCAAGTDKCSYAGLADGGVGRACMPAGAVAEGQNCNMQTDDCAKGLICLSDGKCSKFCYQNSNCTGTGQCLTGITIGGLVEVPVACVNLAACDPLLQNCPSGQGCYMSPTGPACFGSGAVAAGAACTAGNDCVRGAICLGTTGAASCHNYCNRDGGMPNCGGAACGGVTNQQGALQPFGACP